MGRLAREHLVGHRRQGVLVGPRVDLALGGGLLGAHVVRGAEGEAGLGDARSAGLGDGERDAEVGDHRLARLEEDVLGLEVAVDDAAGMGVGQGVAEQGHQADGLVHRELALALEPGAERLAFDVRHDVVKEGRRPRRSRTAAAGWGAAGWR